MFTLTTHFKFMILEVTIYINIIHNVPIFIHQHKIFTFPKTFSIQLSMISNYNYVFSKGNKGRRSHCLRPSYFWMYDKRGSSMMDHNSQHSEPSTLKWTLSNPRSISEKHKKILFQLGADTFRLYWQARR